MQHGNPTIVRQTDRKDMWIWGWFESRTLAWWALMYLGKEFCLEISKPWETSG